MNEAPAEDPSPELDRAAVAMIVILALIVAPVALLATIWVLTEGFDFATTPVFHLVFTGISAFLVALVIYTAIRELRGGLGLRIGAAGVALGSSEIAWSEVEQLEAPAFGLLEISGGGKTLLVRTYLVRDRRALLELVSRRTGKPVPEVLYSY